MDKQEAIKILKEFHDTSALFSVRTALETVFPELKESEDKKIRKALIKYCKLQQKANNIGLCGISLIDIIAWLEKQGESIKIKKGKNYLCTKTHKYAGVEWIEGVKYYSPEDYSLVNQGCTCYCPKYSKEEHNNFFKEVEYNGCLEKQGEPIDDNIITRDDEILQAISIGLTDAVENFGWSNFGGLPIKEIQEWLEKQGEQEPIEWKDSDEKYLFWALLSIQKDIAASEINGVNTKDLNECVKWLYSLKQRIKGE